MAGASGEIDPEGGLAFRDGVRFRMAQHYCDSGSAMLSSDLPSASISLAVR